MAKPNAKEPRETGLEAEVDATLADVAAGLEPAPEEPVQDEGELIAEVEGSREVGASVIAALDGLAERFARSQRG